ncbi:hypothetical protein DL764_006671 [Monosporascus ibericus]|uniref:Transcription regulator Rua1 C-terminal domain-containing protein n=1 Tax=Monosporascus ibericus TaxID=155417 RepID=A0A4Q4T658_9PEZI|nr:hypothetical protein DL764_006671 [Monosporascus ibericus]
MDPNQTQLQSQQMQHSHGFVFDMNKAARRDAPLIGTPFATMNGNEMSDGMETMEAPGGGWTAPASHGLRPRPATIHEGFSYCAGEEYGTVPSWDVCSNFSIQTPSDSMSRPVSMHQDFYPPTTVESHMPNFDGDMGIGQAFTSDEAIPVLDLRYQGSQVEKDPMNFEPGSNRSRRMSGSSFTMSTTGGFSDMPSYDDFSTTHSEAPSLTSDYPPRSNRNSLMSSTQLSPVASPRMTPHNRTELVRAQSRGRGASPSPRPGVRSAPYNADSSARNKRWSTGTYCTARRAQPFVYHHTHDAFGHRVMSRHSSPTVSSNPLPLNFGNLQAAQQHPFMIPQPPAFHNGMFVPSQPPSHVYHPAEIPNFETPPQLLSHGLFRMLQSNADPHALHSHYTDLSDPPDLYASLNEEQIPPPPEDMNPEDPDLIPHEQELRFEGDLYTPRWVRGHGNKREGWCGICKPGRWLVLKNSAFWYDKSFTHGISAATGSPFQEPQEKRRMDGNPDVWEGLCGSCNDWIALVSSKKKGTTWFRHAYKCHTHPKVKDAPKRRRENSHSRLAAPQISKCKAEPPVPSTPQLRPASESMATTPASGFVQSASMRTREQHLRPGQLQPRQTYLACDGMSNMI